MRPNKVVTAVKCSVSHMEVLAGFSSHGNSINIIQFLYANLIYCQVTHSTTGTMQSGIICFIIRLSVTKPVPPPRFLMRRVARYPARWKTKPVKGRRKLLAKRPCSILRGDVEILGLVSKHVSRPPEVSLSCSFVEFVRTLSLWLRLEWN